MIVALTGTGMPFPRLVDALAEYARNTNQEIWVQHGSTPLVEPLCGEPLVPRSELLDRLCAADVVVTHGGSGSIADVLSSGKVPVVVPRRVALNEHVNDHQCEIVDALGSAGRVIPVHDVAELAAAIARAATMTPDENAAPGAELKQALRSEVDRLLDRKPTRRRRAVWRALSILTRLVPVRRIP